MNGLWQDEAKLVPRNGEIYDHFGYDVAIYGETAIIGSPYDGDMGSYSGSVFVFVRRDDGTWEEVQKITPAEREAYDWFGSSVDISGNTAVIRAVNDDERGIESGSGYLYTKIGGK